MERLKLLSAICLLSVLLLTACGSIPADEASRQNTETDVAELHETVEPESQDTVAAEPQETPETGSLIRHHTTEHEYEHGEDGYFNLFDDTVEFELISQYSGTCWICASMCAIESAYQMDNDVPLSLDQGDLLNEIYDDDKDEGIFIGAGVDKGKYGGIGQFVVNELSLGFGDGLVLDGAVNAKGWSIDEIKEGIKENGALYIGIPDTDQSKKGNFDNYYTMNTPDPDQVEFDHSIAVVGWDDHFPGEYFNDEASQDGAWITCNSNYPLGYYYISYDTPFDQLYDPPLFMSVTDTYSKVLSHDCGWWFTDPVITGETTTVANVFKGEGTLAAVGTHVLSDDQDLTIQIMTPDLKESLYTQECHADRKGYCVFELVKPMEVDEYAIAVTYPDGASVEGETKTLDNALSVKVVSGPGQSFILIDGKWLDMSEESTWDQLGCETNNACIKALYKE